MLVVLHLVELVHLMTLLVVVTTCILKHVPRAYGDVATMYSEVIDISGLTNPEFRFLNHMYGDAIGTLEVDLWDASTGTVVGNVFTHTEQREPVE